MKHFALAMAVITFCIGGGAGIAQTVTGAVRGTITDPTGAFVPGASVTATNIASGVATATKTNDKGEYSIRFLQIGDYKLTVTAQGFENTSYGPFSLEIDQTAKIAIPLKIGSTTVNVDVSGQMQPMLNTESASLGETFTLNVLESVPLNGRDFSQLTVYPPPEQLRLVSVSSTEATQPSETSMRATKCPWTAIANSPITICSTARRSTRTLTTRSLTALVRTH
jgi:hypothetical protein